MLALATPVVLAELGWMTMGIVDTLMVGRLGPEAIGAVGIGSSVFLAVGIFALGLLLGLDTLVSQAYGARRLHECHRWLIHGLALALILTPPVSAGLYGLLATLDHWGMDAEVLRLTRPYFELVSWSLLPLLLYGAFRRYLQGMGSVRPVMAALIVANVANVVVNWVLIFGNLGAPALGVVGAAWATLASRIVMAGVLAIVIVFRERGVSPGLFETPLTIELTWLRRLVALGLPAALQVTLEVGVFAAATALAGRLAPTSLAAHQIALNIAGFTFMVPLGIASAGAVRVGHAIGRRDGRGAAHAGWTALLFGATFMSLAALVFVLAPRTLIGAFTTDAAVLRIGVTLLAVAAVFQLFDGLQGVATGILRGLGDTRTPMAWNLVGHWLIGLPAAYTLAFHWDFGIVGLWWGLSLGLIICGVALLAAWWRRIRTALALLPAHEGGSMAEQTERPRPHGDPLENERRHTGNVERGEVGSGAPDRQTPDRGDLDEPNAAQRASDATNDAVSLAGVEEPTAGTRSVASGVSAGDERDGEQQRKRYEGGAELVSKID